MTPVLPFGGLERAGLLPRPIGDALRAAGLSDLAELAGWPRGRLAATAKLTDDELAAIETLMARYCLTFVAERRKRFRRPRHQLDPY